MKTAAKKQAPPLSLDPRRRRAKIMNRLKNDWLLYLLLVPVLAWYLIFCYAPMGGLVLAFKDYSFKLGIWDSPWIGMGNFTKMFSDRYFLRGLKNTLVFGIGGILISMPCEIALALMLNELRLRGMKKFVQTTVTFPHFISWVVLAGILTNIFASTGAINQILRLFGMSAASPITSESGYRWFIWFSGIWKEVGWGSIIYLAAITSVEQDQYESASIDGASRLQQIWHITLPAIRSTICIMLILAVGSLLTNGRFDQIFNTYSSPVYPVADTIDTYIFRETFTTGIMNFGYSTAIGVLKSVVGLFMIVATVFICLRVTFKRGQQIGVTILVDKFPKLAFVFTVFSYLMSILFLSIVTKQSFQGANFFAVYKAPSTGLSFYWLYMSMAAGCGLSALEVFLMLVQRCCTALLPADAITPERKEL